MPAARDPKPLLRWAFLGFGWFLLLCDHFVVHTMLGVDVWARQTYAGHPRRIAFTLLTVTLGLLVSAILCLITARGFRRSRPWARWTGVAACIFLLPGLPWLTIVGAIGLYYLLAKLPRFARPPAAKQTTDYWIRKRKSWAQQVLSVVGFILAMSCLGVLSKYAQHLGMPHWDAGGKGLLYIFVFSLFTTAVHEMGHASMAWALYHRVRVINVGPFTFSNLGHGYQFHFQWKRLLQSGGHVASVPSGGTNLRLRYITMIVAGPAASLLNGFLMLAIFLSTPGSSWQRFWWIPALTCVMAFFDGVFNLIPVGYSDGSMLFHLVLWTHHGKVLLQQIQALQLQEEADVCHKQADFVQEVALRELALVRSEEGGDGSVMAIALSQQALGHARLAAEDWAGAEAAHRACLSHEAECALHPPLAANAWLGLQRASVERHHVPAVGRNYTSALLILEARKKDRDRIGLAVTRAMLAQVHHRAGGYEKALQEIAEALRTLPAGRGRLMLRAILLATEAQCEVAGGSVERGLAAAERVAEIVRSGKLPVAERNLGWDELGELGEGLWQAGQDGPGIDLMREAIEHLEAGGAAETAAQYRVKVSAAYRQLGKLDEAAKWLPAEKGISLVTRRCLLAERTRLHLAGGRTEEAIADARELVALWKAAPHDPTAEVAVAESLLAEASLESGDYSQAETLSAQAAEVLVPWRHFEAAGCLVTRLLAQWRGHSEWTPSSIEEAQRILDNDPLLSPSTKARLREAQAARVRRYGPAKEVQTAVAVAAYS